MSKTIPWFPYQLFFLIVEPISALVGAYYAAGRPEEYLSLLSSSPTQLVTTSTPTLISLYQLSNLYLLFALNEHIVLSSTNSLKTWRRLLFCLLLADFGHLATMWPLALEKGVGEVYFRCWDWNAMEWGSIGFVYMGALMRISFLVGLGLKTDTRGEEKRDKDE
ncbi:unnamed protein product [Somion occarium]|uniref:DUF7704 domain-containing protein n=1 Tax=Somion occarium TaxID=3059160 RepID=A0ABP1CYR3_9APHY